MDGEDLVLNPGGGVRVPVIFIAIDDLETGRELVSDNPIGETGPVHCQWVSLTSDYVDLVARIVDAVLLIVLGEPVLPLGLPL